MRYLYENILKDLNRKMVFIGGPRQVGKTTLSKKILDQAYSSGRYFNWDYNEDRQALLAGKWHDDDGLIVFDELHKYKNWKNWIKGVFDTNEGPAHFLVTGSARLDVGGQSYCHVKYCRGNPGIPKNRKQMAGCPGKKVSCICRSALH